METTAFLEQKKSFEKQIDLIKTRLKATEKKLAGTLDLENRIQWQAEKFDRGNVVVDNENYGKNIGIISDPGGQKNFA